jgi:hypothetical protein
VTRNRSPGPDNRDLARAGVSIPFLPFGKQPLEEVHRDRRIPAFRILSRRMHIDRRFRRLHDFANKQDFAWIERFKIAKRGRTRLPFIRMDSMASGMP